jgi:hypothetical protein
MGWCNADDVLWQGALSQVGRVGREFPEVEWLTGWASTFDEAGTFISVNRCSFFPRQLLAAGLADGTHWHYVQQESTFWRKRLWDRAGGEDPTFQLAGDWDLWRRFAQHAELFHLDRQLGAFHFRRGQKSGDGARYQGECTGRLPAEERLRAYQALLRQTPTLGVQRLSAGPDGKLRRSEERR